MSDVRLIAFYLPQFHPIPENDRWWGEGFTEWTNVRRSTPRFPGHYQPHIPSELGYYDLRDPAVREAQASLAQSHGIHAFCYYHYWFNGKLLLERPLDDVLRSGRPDFPFCLCWANENWTRAWDGQEREILMDQDYSSYDHLEHFRWLARRFADPRYVTIEGKPLFLIYRAEQIPTIGSVIQTWRNLALEAGFAGLYICAVRNMQYPFTWQETKEFGIDALVDFQPNPREIRNAHRFRLRYRIGTIWRAIQRLLFPSMRGVYRYDYGAIVSYLRDLPPLEGTIHPCVFPTWDNSPRRRTNVTVIQNDDPALYGAWLSHAVSGAARNPEGERIVFINAWNEWGEGCHLEPDQRVGRGFLEETKRIVRGG
ncbi:MAG: hypothetical protein Fur0034_21740 [Desulfuromonadia bacterium]